MDVGLHHFPTQVLKQCGTGRAAPAGRLEDAPSARPTVPTVTDAARLALHIGLGDVNNAVPAVVSPNRITRAIGKEVVGAETPEDRRCTPTTVAASTLSRPLAILRTAACPILSGYATSDKAKASLMAPAQLRALP